MFEGLARILASWVATMLTDNLDLVIVQLDLTSPLTYDKFDFAQNGCSRDPVIHG
jgi:hypothetical protein